MKLRNIFGAVMFIGACGLLANGTASAHPAPPPPTVCGAGTSDSNHLCNLIITFNANGSITTVAPLLATSTYDGSDDALIGLVNNSGVTITGLHLVGNDIGGFDDDGIDTYYGAPVSGNPDRTGYGGPLGYFTHNLGNSLDINFYGGLATGSSTYFSLEEPASLSLAISSVAEPASIVLLASGLLLLGFGYRRRW